MSGFALYLHIPFCRRKCAYCDFRSWAGRESDMDAYLRALFREIDRQAERYAEGRTVQSVFFGGGTPSLMSGEQMTSLMDRLRSRFTFSPDAEITMEANPGTLSARSLALYRSAGINRLSIGVQSFDDSLLSSLGRIHTAQEAREAVGMIRAAGFANLNLDLMYGLPGQTKAMFLATLQEALRLAPEHLSLYSLILEEGTPLCERVARGEASVPEDEVTLQMQHEAQSLLSQNGYARYEISNYARPGFECRHNLLYWQRGEYLGLGCAAHSLMENRRFANTPELSEYLAGRCKVESDDLTAQDEFEETVMLGLRTVSGIPRSILAGCEEALGRLVRSGHLICASDRVRATQKGADVLNAVILELVNHHTDVSES